MAFVPCYLISASVSCLHVHVLTCACACTCTCTHSHLISLTLGLWVIIHWLILKRWLSQICHLSLTCKLIIREKLLHLLVWLSVLCRNLGYNNLMCITPRAFSRLPNLRTLYVMLPRKSNAISSLSLSLSLSVQSASRQSHRVWLLYCVAL